MCFFFLFNAFSLVFTAKFQSIYSSVPADVNLFFFLLFIQLCFQVLMIKILEEKEMEEFRWQFEEYRRMDRLKFVVTTNVAKITIPKIGLILQLQMTLQNLERCPYFISELQKLFHGISIAMNILLFEQPYISTSTPFNSL